MTETGNLINVPGSWTGSVRRVKDGPSIELESFLAERKSLLLDKLEIQEIHDFIESLVSCF
jgi:hypothetical protein